VLTGELISAVVAMRLLGPGSMDLSQSLRFPRPVGHRRDGDRRGWRWRSMREKRRVRLATTAANQTARGW
jgi:hypothetical protein